MFFKSVIRSILKMLFNLFPIFLGIYLFFVYVQGFKWHGFIQKHTGIPPLAFLALSIISGVASFLYLKSGRQKTFLYKLMIKLSRIFLPVWAAFSFFLVITNSPFIVSWILRYLFFHWQRFINANLVVTLALGAVVLIDISYNIPKESFIKFLAELKKRLVSEWFSFLNFLGKLAQRYKWVINPSLFLGTSSFFFFIMPKKDTISALIAAVSGSILVILSSILGEEIKER